MASRAGTEGPIASAALSVEHVCHFSRVGYDVPGDSGLALAQRGAPDTSALCPHERYLWSVGRVQPEDLQQPGVCRPPGPVCQPGLRGRLPADAHVHHPHELCQRLGSRVQVSAGGPRGPGPGDRRGLRQQRGGSSGTSEASSRPKNTDQGSERGCERAGWGAGSRWLRKSWHRASHTHAPCLPCHDAGQDLASSLLCG